MDNQERAVALVTGAGGYIGKQVTQKLAEQGFRVIGLVRERKDTAGSEVTGEKKMADEAVFQEECDISDYERLESLFSKYRPNTVIHLAAIVHKRSLLSSYEDFYRINYEASRNLFVLCSRYQVETVLFSSTVEVYGQAAGSLTSEKRRSSFVTKVVIDENTPVDPQSDYGKTKLMAERALIETASPEMRYGILRLAPVYGRGFSLNVDRRVYLKKDRLLYYFGDGSYFFNLCSVNNVTDFIVGFLSKPVPSGVYNLSDTGNYPVKELVERHRSRGILALRLPYSLTYLGIFLVEKLGCLIGKKSFISLYNFEKLFRCVVYSNKKAEGAFGEFTWDYANTMGEALDKK